MERRNFFKSVLGAGLVAGALITKPIKKLVNREWYEVGKLHREDGPAIITKRSW